ncbi:sodium ion-translocating decarboxylase subunit beta, partial [Salmonella enterica subsp. enterica serovar Agona]|nr:sodium ion-translocating decarboxylase subunit beta [Salmonella enterica subsp. enterica serovar Agona]
IRMVQLRTVSKREKILFPAVLLLLVALLLPDAAPLLGMFCFGISAMSLEFSLGLGAHHFPFEHTGYSEVNACKILNGIYNGVQQS